jgi:purine-binding chemotaxis protein CheW
MNQSSLPATASPVSANDAESYILFELAGTTYALRTRDVQHMEMVEHITPVPNAPAFVEGVVFSRGQVVPAVNLRVRFGFERQKITIQSRLIIVRTGQRRVGLMVDSSREFRTIATEAIQPPNDAIAGLSGRYLQGIANLADRLILVLDIRAVLEFVEEIAPPASVAAASAY